MADFAKYAEADKRFINKETIGYYCNTNISLLEDGAAVRGIILEFPGLGGNSCLNGNMDSLAVYDAPFTRECARHGLVVAYMFTGPWSWMNRGAVRVTDLVVDAIADRFGLVEGAFPLIATGGSMGGYAALMYAIETRHKVTACLAHCPCCEPLVSFAGADVFPRSFICAVNEYDMPFEDALRQIAPIHRIADMPRIPYLVTCDELDEFFPPKEVEALVEGMRAAGLDVSYMLLPGMTHGGYTPDQRAQFNAFILKNCGVCR